MLVGWTLILVSIALVLLTVSPSPRRSIKQELGIALLGLSTMAAGISVAEGHTLGLHQGLLFLAGAALYWTDKIDALRRRKRRQRSGHP